MDAIMAQYFSYFIKISNFIKSILKFWSEYKTNKAENTSPYISILYTSAQTVFEHVFMQEQTGLT